MTSLTQRCLDFKLETTSETITSRSGLTVFYETALSLGLVAAIRTHMPRLGSNRAFHPEEYLLPLTLTLIGGGQTLEDTREIRLDQGLRDLCQLDRIPSPDALGRWLRLSTNLKGLKRVNQYLVCQLVHLSPLTDFTLDTDATLIETEKNCARMSYEGFKAFSAMTSYVPELGGLCIAGDYRNGNISPATGIVEQLKGAIRLFASLGKCLKRFRSDSAAYTSEIINLCFKHKITFTIAADQDSAVKQRIRAISDSAWQRLYDRDHVYTERQYARIRHSMEKTTSGFDLVVIRWLNPRRDLFSETPYCYHVIATDDYDHNGEEVIWFYNARGTMENYLKELKNGFGMEYAPCRQLRANGVYFQVGVLAYNLVVAFKHLVNHREWMSKTIATLRWEIVGIAGKVVRHAGQLILRVMKCHYQTMQYLRTALRACPRLT
jgi:hypothetical protein